MRIDNKGTVKILSDLTFKKLNIDCEKLNPGSHKRIYVECQRCSEIFLRERRKLHQFHACPSHKTRSDGVKLKWCNKCKNWLTYEAFSKNIAKKDGLNSWCADCCKTTENYKKSAKIKILARKTLDGWIKNFLAAKKGRCQKRGVICSVTDDDLMELWRDQQGRCYYSNIKLVYGKSKLNSASLDRLDSSKGYTKNNVVWASKAMNNLKNCYSEDEVTDFVKSAQFYRVRLEIKKEHPKAQLPSRKRTTDAAWDLYAVEDAILEPNVLTSIDTGICISCPEGYYITIEGRSGLYSKGIFPTRGIIDSGYTDTIRIMLTNLGERYQIKAGDRIAQMIVHHSWSPDFTEVEEFSPEYSIRGKKGFGSSGR